MALANKHVQTFYGTISINPFPKNHLFFSFKFHLMFPNLIHKQNDEWTVAFHTFLIRNKKHQYENVVQKTSRQKKEMKRALKHSCEFIEWKFLEKFRWMKFSAPKHPTPKKYVKKFSSFVRLLEVFFYLPKLSFVFFIGRLHTSIFIGRSVFNFFY